MTPQQAYRKVRSAIAQGVLVRPDSCPRCGRSGTASDGRSLIHAHHHDYSKPLDVEWVCAKCHREETPLPEVMGAPVLGEKNGQAKLSETEVISARRLRSNGVSFQKIADRFGVNKSTIIRACNGEQWKHVAAAPKPPAQEDAKDAALKVAEGCLNMFEQCVSKIVDENYAKGYREACDHIIAAMKESNHAKP